MNRTWDPFALSEEGVSQHKTLARQALAQARAHRQGGDLNAADAEMRQAAVFRADAFQRRSPARGVTAWRYGDTPAQRIIP